MGVREPIRAQSTLTSPGDGLKSGKVQCRRHFSILSGSLLFMWVSGAQAQAPDAAIRAVLSQAVLTRALAIENPVELSRHLTSFPPGFIEPKQRTSSEWRALWSLFFKGSMTKLALQARRPHILFLNPTADVAVIASCPQFKSTGLPICRHLCAMPGEALGGETAGRHPSWTSSQKPFEAMQASAKARLQSFGSLYDSRSATVAPKLCSQNLQGIAEVRQIERAHV